MQRRRSPTLGGMRLDLQCEKCNLHETRNNIVLGEGPSPCDIMLIGEAPGREEDYSGRPFVGQAGTILDIILNRVDLSRGLFYITNAVKCRPPGNRRPLFSERLACKDWLFEEIEEVRPRKIILMGKTAQWSFGRAFKFGERYQMKLTLDNIDLRAVYHPAYALHREGVLDMMTEQYRWALE